MLCSRPLPINDSSLVHPSAVTVVQPNARSLARQMQMLHISLNLTSPHLTSSTAVASKCAAFCLTSTSSWWSLNMASTAFDPQWPQECAGPLRNLRPPIGLAASMQVLVLRRGGLGHTCRPDTAVGIFFRQLCCTYSRSDQMPRKKVQWTMHRCLDDLTDLPSWSAGRLNGLGSGCLGVGRVPQTLYSQSASTVRQSSQPWP